MSLDKLDIHCLDYNDLINEVDLTNVIEKAFGKLGEGIITVKNVPNLLKMRQRLLPLASKLANLSDDDKEKLVLPETCYCTGWSHGKETLQGEPDYAKVNNF